jgi:predicted RND superfamily exporter protein
MVFASIKSIVFFGVLLSFTIFNALLCELTILPAQICLLRRFLASDFALPEKEESADRNQNISDLEQDADASDESEEKS